MTSMLQSLLALTMVFGLAVVFLHARSVAFLVPLLSIAAVIVYFIRARRSARNNNESAAILPGQGSSDEVRAIASVTAKVFAGVVAAGALYWAADRAVEKAHPPVEEHRPELLAAAANAADCPKEQINVVGVSTKTARVEGCGAPRYFLWGKQRRDEPMHWRQFDPKCTVEWLGLQLPCE
jgi:hypothetical protein